MQAAAPAGAREQRDEAVSTPIDRRCRVFVVDNNTDLARTLSEVIGFEPDFEAVGFSCGGLDALTRAIEAQADVLEESGLSVECILAGGDPASEIAAAVIREKCDLVAMSTHGHKGMQDIIRGSVANEVRHRVTVPVLMVRGVPRRLRQV